MNAIRSGGKNMSDLESKIDVLTSKMDSALEHLATINGRVYKHESEKADKDHLIAVQKKCEENYSELRKAFSKIDTKVWKMLLYMVGAGAVGSSGPELLELLKQFFMH